MEPGGIEPHPNPSSFTQNADPEYSRAILRAVQGDPTLNQLVQLWPVLPHEVRQAIGLLSRAHAQGESHEEDPIDRPTN